MSNYQTLYRVSESPCLEDSNSVDYGLPWDYSEKDFLSWARKTFQEDFSSVSACISLLTSKGYRVDPYWVLTAKDSIRDCWRVEIHPNPEYHIWALSIFPNEYPGQEMLWSTTLLMDPEDPEGPPSKDAVLLALNQRWAQILFSLARA